MTHTQPSTFETAIRFTSIEPVSQHSNLVSEIADRHGFVAEFRSEELVNAPFCGIDYHVQEIRLTQENSTDPVQWVNCLNDLSEFENEHLADSFFEVIE